MSDIPPSRNLNDAEKAAVPHVVVVTGCTGFLGSRLVQRLLLGGHTVHGTCRNASSSRAKELMVFEGAAKRLTLFEADLLVQDSFDAAMDGCDTLFHVASPISQNVKPEDAEAVLFVPAVEGTKNVLSSVNKFESVTRVVLTSSVSAIYGKLSPKLKVYTSDDWNTECSASYLPYPHSKVLAEKAAWEIANAQSRWTMAAMCPSMIFGAPAIDTPVGTLDVVRRLVSGEVYPFVPLFGFGIVDLDDVCQGHVMAMIKHETTGRFILDYDGYPSFLMAISDMLRPRYGNKYRLPKWSLPRSFRFIFKHIVGPVMGVEKAFVDAHYGGKIKYDNSPAVQELGVKFHSPKAGLEEAVEFLINKGSLPNK